MPTATNGHNPVTVSQLAANLAIDPNQAILLLSELGVKADSPESPVPPVIASQLMQVQGDVNSFASPRLMGEARANEEQELEQQRSAEPEVGEPGELEPGEPGTLTLADVKTIAEVNSVSIKLVQDMVDAMQSKYEKLLLQQGYYTQKREQAIANLGSTLATMEAYREKVEDIKKKQEELLNFDPAKFLKGHGIDLQELMKAQMEFEKKQAEVAEGKPEEKTPFDKMVDSLGKLL